MNFENIAPFLLIIAPLVIGFFLEALVIYFFKIRTFWGSVGLSLIVNLLSLIVLYAGNLVIGKLGYSFDGVQPPLPVVFALWWLSVLSDGFILQFFFKGQSKTAYRCSIAMNFFSYLFLYVFISVSH